jgi:transcriptional regulator with XRE-family HTH domain
MSANDMGRFLQDSRFRSELSVLEVAEKAEVSVGTIRAIEQGRRIPSAKTLKAILPVIGLENEACWIDAVTWKDPIGGRIYNLAPRNGGKATSDQSPIEQLPALRVEAIEAVLKADWATIQAVLTLLNR